MHLLDYGKALCGKGRTSARAGLRHGPKRRHTPGFGKVGASAHFEDRRIPDFGKALFSDILGLFWWMFGPVPGPGGRQAARLKKFR